MSKIHLNRARQNLGEFTPEEVAQGLRDGRFLPSDLAWREGMETWQPLSTLQDLPNDAAESEPAIEESVAQADLGPAKPDWERRDEIGYSRAVLGTIRQTITDPIATFRDMKRTGGLIAPFVYCYCLQVACGLTSALLSLVWARVLPKAWMPVELGANPSDSLAKELVFSVPAIFVGGLLIPFIGSGVYYLMVKLLTKRPVTYEVIFRAYCYMAGSLSILNLIPVPPIPAVQYGFILFIGIIAITYQTIAIRESAGTTTLEAAAAVLLPGLLCCLCGAAIGGAFFALGGANSFPGAGH
jgi:hypothetical protein